MKKIGIISDTHGTFDRPLMDFLADVDEIWHAGDIGPASLADTIAAFKPLRAVPGNIDDNDVRLMFPAFNYFTCEGVSVLMTHIGSYMGHYTLSALEKIDALKPGIFVSGHSHILKVMYDKKYGLLQINPGAAGRHGFHHVRTAIRLEIEGGDIRNLEVGEWKRQ